MTNWLIIGGACVAMLIAVIIEVTLNYMHGWEDETGSGADQVGCKHHIVRTDTKTQTRKEQEQYAETTIST